jgi:hypothetical protein
MTAAGSPAHAAWLEQQLKAPTSPPREAKLAKGETSPSHDADRCSYFNGRHSVGVVQSRDSDTSLGSSRHANWLERQLFGSVGSDSGSAGSSKHETPHQPDIEMPPGVNAVLRGQDLSALSHAEWLERQLEHRRPHHQLVSLQRRAESQTITPIQPLNRAAPTPPPPPQSMPQPAVVVEEQGDDLGDYALGSKRHAAWLELQLRGGRAVHMR